MPLPFELVVYGTPAPQGSKQFLGFRKSAKGRMKAGTAILAEMSKRNKPWRKAVEAEAKVAWGHETAIDAPVFVTMVFTLPKPVSAPKRRKTYPQGRPDLSKLARSCEDSLVSAGILKDDSRIIGMSLAKVYPSEHEHALAFPGVWVRIEGIG